MNIQSAISIQLPFPIDASLCNYVLSGATITIENTSTYLSRVPKALRKLNTPILWLEPAGNYPIQTFVDSTTIISSLKHFKGSLADSSLLTIVPEDYINYSELSSLIEPNLEAFKTTLALEEVNNTSDVNKPVSTLQATAIATKIDKTSIVNDLTTGGTTNVLSAQQGVTLKTQLDSVASGSPAGSYANLATLILADPDHTRIYLTIDDGKWNYWNGSTFVAGGDYQTALNIVQTLYGGSTTSVPSEKAVGDKIVQIESDIDIIKGGGLNDDSLALAKLTQAARDYIGSGGTVTNNPDDINLETKTGSVIGLKDSNFNGYIVDTLSKLQELITADAQGVYVISNDITLSENITLPEKVILDFRNGSISRFKITFQNTELKGDIKISSLFAGTIKNKDAFSNWITTENNNGLGVQLMPNTWTIGSGSVDIYSQLGLTSENERVYDLNHLGQTVILWECRPSGNGGYDGGWQASLVTIDNTKTYRYSVFIKTSANTGATYFGALYDGVCALNTTTLDANPYFFASALPQQNKWYLLVGYVFPYGTTGNSPNGGIWDCETGEKVSSSVTCFNNANVTTAIHRVFHYDDTDTATRQWMWQPRIDIIDGNEPSVTELLAVDYVMSKCFISLASILFPYQMLHITNDISIVSQITAGCNINCHDFTIFFEGSYIDVCMIINKEVDIECLRIDCTDLLRCSVAFRYDKVFNSTRQTRHIIHISNVHSEVNTDQVIGAQYFIGSAYTSNAFNIDVSGTIKNISGQQNGTQGDTGGTVRAIIVGCNKENIFDHKIHLHNIVISDIYNNDNLGEDSDAIHITNITNKNISSFHNIIIENCEIKYGNKRAIKIQCDCVKIKDCTIDMNSADGTHFGYIGIDFMGWNCIAERNEIICSKRNTNIRGINIEAANNSIIKNNTIKFENDTRLIGVYSATENLIIDGNTLISNNTIYDETYGIIHIGVSGSYFIYDNTITGTVSNGIFTKVASKVYLSGNFINTERCIVKYDSDGELYVKDNTFEGEAGIFIYPAAASALKTSVSKNNFINTRLIIKNAASTEIIDNTLIISDDKDMILALYCEKAVIANNTLFCNATTGVNTRAITIQNSHHTAVVKNTVYGDNLACLLRNYYSDHIAVADNIINSANNISMYDNVLSGGTVGYYHNNINTDVVNTKSGTTKPTLNSDYVYFDFFKTDTKKTIYFNTDKWYDIDGVIENTQRAGYFSGKPTVSANNIPIGFVYFCTDRQTTEGSLDGIEIFHKGSDVWVDALGRVVS